MIYGNKTKNDKKHSPLQFIGSVLTASLIMLGAASCNPGGETTGETAYDDSIEEGVATEDRYTTMEPVANTEVNYFEDWDRNRDNQWDEQEFTTGIRDAGLYSDWDTNNDDMFSDDELNEGFFNTWDADDSGTLSNEEYTTANGVWEDDFGNNFEAWDTNDDNILDNDEFTAGVGEAGIYDEWNLNEDDLYSEDELYGGLYRSWDTNKDGFMDTAEYTEVRLEE